jgi:hypothetical protein
MAHQYLVSETQLIGQAKDHWKTLRKTDRISLAVSLAVVLEAVDGLWEGPREEPIHCARKILSTERLPKVGDPCHVPHGTITRGKIIEVREAEGVAIGFFRVGMRSHCRTFRLARIKLTLNGWTEDLDESGITVMCACGKPAAHASDTRCHDCMREPHGC